MVIRSARNVVVALALVGCASQLLLPPLAAQGGRGQWRGVPPVQVADVTILHTAHEPNILVRVVARGLTDASSFAFLPDGSILVTEKEGRLRIIRDGVLDPTPLLEIPVNHGSYSGLADVALHPDFARNRFIYLTYPRPDGGRGVVLARARFDGGALGDLETLFETTGGPIGASASRILFAPDGSLFMSVAGAFQLGGTAARAQDPHDHAGKILRLTDTGMPAPGNPFFGDDRYLPEIWSLGHRNPMGLAFHPETGDLWADEHGPQGGDEVNIVLPGHDYGWPDVSYGRDYPGPRVSQRWYDERFDIPTVVFLPSIATSGMTFYTGDRFPAWKGNLFVGSLLTGRTQRTGHIERVILNEDAEEVGREAILTELRQRIRDVHQGPDGFIYALTDEDEGQGILLRLEPVE
jgi:glucose/arabinose dehydrogenase